MSKKSRARSAEKATKATKGLKTTLTEEVAKPDLVGVRQAWPTDTMVAGLTPDRLDAILRQANTGDMDAFLTLAEEMEERDPHYGSVLQTRKLAVMGLERKLTWAKGAEKDPRAEEILEACQTLVAAPEFDSLIEHLLDAIAKGYAAPEIIWDTTQPRWTPVDYLWRDPRWFQFDRATGRELRLKEQGAINGAELPPHKFVVHLASRKSGLPARGGLARLVAFSFVCKLYGVKDWMAYAEIFGIPLRLGTYDGSASAADIEVLKRAVFGLGSDAAAVIPKSMTIEFPDLGGAAGGAELFMMLVTWLDNQVSKAVVGQTGTTDMQKGGGFAQSKVLNEVRGDLTKADAKATGSTATRRVLAPFVAFNWGPDAPVPNCELVVEEPEDMEALSKALERLVPLGFKVSQAEIRKKLKLSEPDQADEVLIPPVRTATPPATDGLTGELGSNPDEPPTATARLTRARAQVRTLEREALADIEGAIAPELADWSRNFGPEAAAVMKVVAEAETWEEISAGLQALASDLSAPLSARSLAKSMFAAAAQARGDQAA